MVGVRRRGEQVRKFILESVAEHPREIVRLTTDKFGISRQAVSRHLRLLVEQGALVPAGVTRARAYRLAPLVTWERSYPRRPGLEEHVVWREVAEQLGQLPDNVRAIWSYAFTEMFNNAIDHSDGNHILVTMEKTAAASEISVYDDGVGIFRKIQAALGLLDERHAVLELAKGKFTTDPSKHTGEGIFFTSRVLDQFRILSGEVYFSHEFNAAEDWILQPQDTNVGTFVQMQLNNHTARTVKATQEEFEDSDHAFTKTVVPVALARYGDENLVSRSQAKRLLARVDRFQTVMLDFRGIESIGQSFADEIFRVFKLEHPEVNLFETNAAPDVAAMIARARSGPLANGEQAIPQRALLERARQDDEEGDPGPPVDPGPPDIDF